MKNLMPSFRTLAACMAAMAFSSPVLMAELNVTFNGDGDNTTPSGTITVDLGTNTATLSNLTGTQGINPPTISGALAGLSGSFDISFRALGDSNRGLFDPLDYSGALADGVYTTANEWGVNSPPNANINTFPGQGLVFTFDFTNLVGATGVDLSAVRWQSQNDALALSIRDGGIGTPALITSGGAVISPFVGSVSGASNNETITFTVPLETADQLAYYGIGGGGQRRLKEFRFNFVPAGITPPVGLTAATDGAKIDLNWADDLSGTLDYYSVYRSGTLGGPYSQIATNVPTSDYTDTTVTTGTTYFYVVTATDNIGPTESGNSDEVEITVSIQPPAGLAVTQGDGVLELDWADNTSGILDFYTVYRSETQGVFVDPPIASDLATSDYSDTSVTNGTTYYYVVTATDDVVASESGTSAEVSGTPYTPVTGSVLYAHLDATDVPSVVETAGVVSQWNDLTPNGNNAVSAVGEVNFPSALVSEAGLDGLEVGVPSKSTLLMFDPAGQNTWLDFTDGAGALPYSGFAVFVAVHTETILAGINRDVVLSSIESKFAMRYQAGRPEFALNGQLAQNSATAVVGEDETLILAANYNAATGELEFWDSATGSSTTITVPAGDFSVDTQGMFLGGSVNPDQYMNGVIGEVKIYRGVMDAAAFETERRALSFKWAGLTEPAGLVATSGDGVVDLDWSDQTADFYTVYRDSALIADNLTASAYSDTSVVNGTTYEYFVTATKDGEESFDSDVVSATPFAPVAGSALYVHYDATDAGSVTVVNGNEVTEWADLTGNGFHATADAGTLLYPSSSLSPTSLAGLDTGDVTKNTLLAFTVSQQDSWLDFTSSTGALPYSGFAVFAVVKADGILGSSKRDIVFANNGNPVGTGNLVLRYSGGIPQVILGGQLASQGGIVVDPGDTVVLAANYRIDTGELEFWDSENGSSVTITVPVTDFSSTQGMFLGGSLNGEQSMEGMIGEVKVYRGAMTPAEFANERNALQAKWIGTVPGFSTWITGSFANGTVANQGPDDDDDGDGISNLLEYALAGEDPTVPNPSIGVFTGNSLSFTKRGDASGLTYAIKESADLGVSDPWTEVAGGSYVNDAATISYTFTPGTPAKNFLRLEVTN